MTKAGTTRWEERKQSGIVRLRVWLGIAQMAGVICTVVLLLETGVSRASLLSTVITCLLTSVSVLAFGNRSGRQRHNDRKGS
jgi:hypothetical protein